MGSAVGVCQQWPSGHKLLGSSSFRTVKMTNETITITLGGGAPSSYCGGPNSSVFKLTCGSDPTPTWSLTHDQSSCVYVFSASVSAACGPNQ